MTLSNKEFFDGLDVAKSLISRFDDWETTQYIYGSFSSMLLEEIADRGGVYSLKAKKVLELLEDH